MIWLKRPSYTRKEHFITLDSIDSLVLERAPDFLDYLFFHNLLDKYCFALKSHYSDREAVKKRRYRLDLVFQNYLVGNEIGAARSAPSRRSSTLESRIEFNLTKGWHNELVRGDPLLPDYLKVGVQLSGWRGPGTGGLARVERHSELLRGLRVLQCRSSDLVSYAQDRRSQETRSQLQQSSPREREQVGALLSVHAQ